MLPRIVISSAFANPVPVLVTVTVYVGVNVVFSLGVIVVVWNNWVSAGLPPISSDATVHVYDWPGVKAWSSNLSLVEPGTARTTPPAPVLMAVNTPFLTSTKPSSAKAVYV